ncbi:unnamed protein product [Blepharisma stoltei]|uniref:Uncharacterized protein n=1 Tax=Blepharisma stoltei TaxID=1481888 RepID=A0AAU9IS44_9CILI|nr:unnamed protein product [Blepharisma stoltei]
MHQLKILDHEYSWFYYQMELIRAMILVLKLSRIKLFKHRINILAWILLDKFSRVYYPLIKFFFSYILINNLFIIKKTKNLVSKIEHNIL